MNINLNWYEWLQVYISDDGVWIYDPYSGQIYQHNGFNYVPIGVAQPDDSAIQPLPTYPTASVPTQPVYVAPPHPGSVVQSPVVRAPVYVAPPPPRVTATPVIARPVVNAPPVSTALPSSGVGQTAPVPRQGGAASLPVATKLPVTGSGGTVRGKNEPDPKQGYWEVVGRIGLWTKFDGHKFFHPVDFPATKVRYPDGKPWNYGKLAVYGSDESYYKNGYFLIFDNPDGQGLGSYKDSWLAVQIKPVLPF